MTVKPFKIIADDSDTSEKVEEESYISPQKFEPNSSLDTVVDEAEDNEAENVVEEQLASKVSIWDKINQLLSSFSGIFLAVIIFSFLAVLAHTTSSLISIFSTPSIADYIYLLGLIILLIALIMNINSNIRQLLELKNAKKLQYEFSLQKKEPTEEVIPLCLSLCNHYERQADESLQTSIDDVKDNLNASQIYKETYKDIDEKLLKSLDDKAKLAIKDASLQIAFSTAASPVPIIDMFLIVWRSFSLTKEIATIYGFRPGGLTSLILLKQGAVNVIFAGVSELVMDMTNDVVGATVVNKISQATGQGMANGILLARLGYGVLDACRPIKIKSDKESIIKIIIESFLSSTKNK